MRKDVYKKVICNLILWAILLSFLILVLPRMIGFFLPFIIGFFIALIVSPMVRFLEEKVKIVHKCSSVLVIVAVLFLVVLLLYFASIFVINQGVDLLEDLPRIYRNVEGTISQIALRFQDQYKKLPKELKMKLMEAVHGLNQYGNEIGGLSLPTLGDASSLVKDVADLFFYCAITIMSAYFFVAEKSHLVERFEKFFSKEGLAQYHEVTDGFKQALGGYIKAQFKITLVIMAILCGGFLIIRIDYAIILGILIALLDFLPVFGTGTVLWPWMFLDIVKGYYNRALILLILYIICQVAREVLQPKMVGDSIGISPLMTLFLMFVGYKVFGMAGMIFAVPVGMVVKNLYEMGMFTSLIEGMKVIIKEINDYRKA